jgi:peptide deformylase
VSILEILTYPNQFLRTKTKAVENIDGTLQELIAAMADTMYAVPGIGLAAIQVGSDQSMLIYDMSAEEKNGLFQVIINPKIVDQHGEIKSEDEGCLSVPEYRSTIKRAESVLVEGIDKDGNPIQIEAEGFHSIVLQHEIDHLNGTLFIDHMSALKRKLFKKRFLKNP